MVKERKTKRRSVREIEVDTEVEEKWVDSGVDGNFGNIRLKEIQDVNEIMVLRLCVEVE